MLEIGCQQQRELAIALRELRIALNAHVATAMTPSASDSNPSSDSGAPIRRAAMGAPVVVGVAGSVSVLPFDSMMSGCCSQECRGFPPPAAGRRVR